MFEKIIFFNIFSLYAFKWMDYDLYEEGFKDAWFFFDAIYSLNLKET